MIAIRRAGPDDAAAVLVCLREAFEPYRAAYTPEAFEDTVLTPSSVSRRLAEMTVLVAVDDAGRTVGTIGFARVGDLEGHLRGMAVRPDAQGGGVAQALLDAAEAELRRTGCSRVSLDTTLPLARATRFYVRNGFVATGKISDFFGMPLHEYVKALASPRRGGLTAGTPDRSVLRVHASDHAGEPRSAPTPELLAAARLWLAPVRDALGAEFTASYVTGSALRDGFDPRRSAVNVVVVARELEPQTLDRVRAILPESRKPPRFQMLLLTRSQIESSLDSFPIEWLEIKERHALLDGDDVLGTLEVPRTHLRLQCEHELRAKHIQLRQNYLASAKQPNGLQDVLEGSASSFATLFRTLLRLEGEPVPAKPEATIERVAARFGLDARPLLAAYAVRHASRRYGAGEIVEIYRAFLMEISRLVVAIDQLRVP